MKIIVFEGLDFSGKSTLIKEYLKIFWDKKKIVEHFPRKDSKYGKKINEIKQKNNLNKIDYFELFNLFSLDRKDFFENFNYNCDILIFDRYIDSNIVYFYDILKDDINLSFNEFANFVYMYEYDILKIPKYDKLIFVNTPPEICIERMKYSNRESIDNFEKNIEKYNKRYMYYNDLYKNKENIIFFK